ncbi:hypothetical protein AMTRI_Chr13g92470 [Amborella trichopoda]|uniref:uncharacterized protein LOC18445890 n=1 Tax=Amborella trichopoda TaxID=13333 RepID=UPI0005D2FA8B|nr:uncharacterized protein LOC18445890 [Amborella trichopoda]|eukprot:XP_011627760.1 uncharacterized protein LOC18445890 [Amborella trichopoda]
MPDHAQYPPWLDTLLSEKFFSPCLLHESSKKNEKNIFCLDCCTSICPHCLHYHRSHRLLQVRRYVYHDVIRLDDLEKLIDCGFVQSYTTNSAKVVFLNQRPQSRPFKGSGSVCHTCDRSLQDPYHFCSLSCKVSYLLRYEGCVSRYLYECEYLPLSDFVKEMEDGQMTPISVLDGGISLRTSSGSSANGAVECRTLACTATTETVTRRKRTAAISSRNRQIAAAIRATCQVVSRRKGVPHRSPFF